VSQTRPSRRSAGSVHSRGLWHKPSRDGTAITSDRRERQRRLAERRGGGVGERAQAACEAAGRAQLVARDRPDHAGLRAGAVEQPAQARFGARHHGRPRRAQLDEQPGAAGHGVGGVRPDLEPTDRSVQRAHGGPVGDLAQAGDDRGGGDQRVAPLRHRRGPGMRGRTLDLDLELVRPPPAVEHAEPPPARFQRRGALDMQLEIGERHRRRRVGAAETDRVECVGERDAVAVTPRERPVERPQAGIDRGAD
jgi:hypothetical protein